MKSNYNFTNIGFYIKQKNDKTPNIINTLYTAMITCTQKNNQNHTDNTIKLNLVYPISTPAVQITT